MTRDTDLARPIALTLALVLAIDLAFVLVVAYLLRPWLGPRGRRSPPGWSPPTSTPTSTAG